MRLAELGANVFLACRTPATAEVAVAEIQARTGNKHLRWHTLDLASFDSIRQFAAWYRDYKTLDVLINNAGVMDVPLGHTKASDSDCPRAPLA